jgi:hypothetical protein
MLFTQPCNGERFRCPHHCISVGPACWDAWKETCKLLGKGECWWVSAPTPYALATPQQAVFLQVVRIGCGWNDVPLGACVPHTRRRIAARCQGTNKRSCLSSLLSRASGWKTRSDVPKVWIWNWRTNGSSNAQCIFMTHDQCASHTQPACT